MKCVTYLCVKSVEIYQASLNKKKKLEEAYEDSNLEQQVITEDEMDECISLQSDDSEDEPYDEDEDNE